MCSVAVPLYSVTRDRPRFQRMQRFWARELARAWGMEVTAHGTEQLDPSQTYVFMANHLSHADIVALFCALPMNVGFLAKKELSKVPFLAQAIFAGGHVLVDRRDNSSAMTSMSQAAQDVASGSSLVIFPEGTRADREVIQPFKKGGFHLARQAKVPVVPVGIRGTRSVMGREDLVVRPGKVAVHVGAPVRVTDFENAALCSDYVRKQVSELAAMPRTDQRFQG
ncbi:MAG: 1-acyl-sn-glycerol-3-phosphate acyltransferase [Myxococcaceae bacterium]|nr:1-acyl-sn-glycerol-3-phosphate acyltransferase [Myxococcaceae bacterium]